MNWARFGERDCSLSSFPFASTLSRIHRVSKPFHALLGPFLSKDCQILTAYGEAVSADEKTALSKWPNFA